MDNKAFLEQLECTGIVPVIKLENTADAADLAKALYDVGAGTVLTTEQCDSAMEAGAKFCVAPGLNPKVVEHCLGRGVPFAPGVANGSQIEQAMELGLDFVKFFPAEQAGGLPYIKAVSAPYSSMKFMPTGGINENNLNSYLAFKKIVCCGGSWIVPDKLVKAGKWEDITALCRSAVNKMLGFELAHIGINCADESEALNVSAGFEKMFGWEQRPGNSSVFAGSVIECMKQPFRGAKGHIAVAVNSVKRAVTQLKYQGIEVDMSSAKYDADGRMTVVYLKDEIGGFAVHLVEK